MKVYTYTFFLRRDSEHNEVIDLSKYSNIFKALENLVCLDFRVDFCACVLIDEIYIVGGEDPFCNSFDLCIHYNSKNNRTKETASMEKVRALTASANYRGKIVVSMGWVPDVNNVFYTKNSVEFYDHIAKTLSPLPNMIERRVNHNLVAIKSKLFSIDKHNTSEMLRISLLLLNHNQKLMVP